MLTAHGPMCDVCGEYIIFDQSTNPFSVGGIESTLLCHDACKSFVLSMFEKEDFRALPPGPLRDLYEQAERDGALESSRLDGKGGGR